MATSTETILAHRPPTVAMRFDRWWWAVAAVLTPVFVYLNEGAQGMQGVYLNYVCYRRVITHGFDPAADLCPSPTFPMWGYGWLLTVTENKFLLLVLQGLFALGAVWFFLRALERLEILRGTAMRLVKVALLLSVPWYASNALRWPYSEAAALLLFSIALLLIALSRADAPYRLFAASGVCLGLALNFRSDYIALPVLAAVVVLALSRHRLRVVKQLAVWGAAIVVLLAPWALYAHRATHHLLLTSTNGGHVLYISLGQLPGNPWNITPTDGDPRMHRELDAHFGRRHVSSLTYASDVFLRKRFFELVRRHPAAWVHKDALNGVHTLTDGFYDGEFIMQSSCGNGAGCWLKYGWNGEGTTRVRSHLSTLFGGRLSVGERVRFALVQAGAIQGRLVSLFGFPVAAILLGLAFRRRNISFALIAIVPAYQLLMNTFTYELPGYSSNVYLFLLAAMGIVAAAGVRRVVAADAWSSSVTIARSTFARTVGQTLAVRLVTLATGMVATVVLARALGPTGRGLYAVAGALGATGLAFANLGLQTSNTYYVSRDRSLLPRLMGNSAAISFGVAPLGALVVWLIFLAIPDAAPVRGTLLWVALLAVPIGLAYLLFQNLLLGLQDYRRYNLVEIVARVGGLLLLVGLLAAGVRNIPALFAAGLVPNAFAAAWAWISVRRSAAEPPRWSRDVLRTTLHYGVRAYLGSFFAFMLLRSDLLIVKYRLGAEQTGYYSVAVSLADLLYIVPTVVGMVIFPRLASMADTRLRRTVARQATIGVTIGMALLAVVAVLVAHRGIVFVFGYDFEPAAGAFAVLAAAMIFYGANNIVSNYAAASAYPWFAVWIWLIGFVLNIGLNFALIGRFGIKGSALASLVCYGVVAVGQWIYFFGRVRGRARQA